MTERWYGYATAQGLALATWAIMYLAAETKSEPVPCSWGSLTLGLVLSLIFVVPLALVFGVVDGAAAAPDTAEGRGVACVVLVLFAIVSAAAARYSLDFGNVSPPDQLQSTPGEWTGALIGMEIGLVLEMLVGLGVSVVLGPAVSPRGRR